MSILFSSLAANLICYTEENYEEDIEDYILGLKITGFIIVDFETITVNLEYDDATIKSRLAYQSFTDAISQSDFIEQFMIAEYGESVLYDIMLQYSLQFPQFIITIDKNISNMRVLSRLTGRTWKNHCPNA